ncbi:MAG: hypothetical protein ACR2F2_04735 [Pyrinomonadaceae bacterium]
MSNNINIDVRVFEQRTSFNDYLGFNNPVQNQPSNTSGAVASDLDGIFALWDKPTNSNNNGAFANINNLFADPSQTPRVETYGGFQFKNSNEQSAVDQALAELRQQQALNPGKKVSKKIKVGKYKLTINLNEDGSVNIKRKKKRGGLFGKIGGLFKKVGGFLKKALPIISTVAMFIPGLQPLALAARVASGVMGVVDGIKNGNIFGALTSAVGAFSGIGGKISGAFSNLTSKASGLMNSIGGAGSNWFSNAVNTASNFVSKAKDVWSGFTIGISSRVSDFVFKNGSNVFGNWLNQNGSNLLKNFADSMGSRAVNWLNDRAGGVLNRLMDNPLGQRVNGFLNSDFGRYILNSLLRRQA